MKKVFSDLVQALHLERRLGDGEVDHGHARANVRRELDRRIAGRQKDGERGRQVDVLKKEEKNFMRFVSTADDLTSCHTK